MDENTVVEGAEAPAEEKPAVEKPVAEKPIVHPGKCPTCGRDLCGEPK